MCGNRNIGFDKIEIIKRNHNNVNSKIVNISYIKNFNIDLKKNLFRFK